MINASHEHLNQAQLARFLMSDARQERSFDTVGFFLAVFIGFGPKLGPNGRQTGCYGAP